MTDTLEETPWGGYYEGVKSCQQDELNIFNLEPCFEFLKKLDDTKKIYELLPILKSIPDETVNKLNSPLLDALTFKKKIPLIVRAAYMGSIDAIKFLLKRGANLHGNHHKALRFAAKKGHLHVVKFICDRGGDFSALDYCAIKSALLNNHVNVVKYFAEKDPKILNNILSFSFCDEMAKRDAHETIAYCVKNISYSYFHNYRLSKKVLQAIHELDDKYILSHIFSLLNVANPIDTIEYIYSLYGNHYYFNTFSQYVIAYSNSEEYLNFILKNKIKPSLFQVGIFNKSLENFIKIVSIFDNKDEFIEKIRGSFLSCIQYGTNIINCDILEYVFDNQIITNITGLFLVVLNAITNGNYDHKKRLLNKLLDNLNLLKNDEIILILQQNALFSFITPETLVNKIIEFNIQLDCEKFLEKILVLSDAYSYNILCILRNLNKKRLINFTEKIFHDACKLNFSERILQFFMTYGKYSANDGFFYSILANNVENAKYFVKRGAQPSCCNSDPKLNICSFLETNECVNLQKYLLELGAYDHRCICVKKFIHSTETIVALLKVHPEYTNLALYECLRHGSLSTFEALLENYGEKVNLHYCKNILFRIAENRPPIYLTLLKKYTYDN